LKFRFTDNACLKNDRASTTITGPEPVIVDIPTPAKTRIIIAIERVLALELKSIFESRQISMDTYI